MSETLRDSLLRKVIRPEIQSSVLTPTTGIVRTVYPDAMKLDLFLRAPWTGTEILVRRVPMLITPGVANPMPRAGDTVNVVFQGNTMQSAVVTARVDEHHATAGRASLTHPGKGAYLPDLL